MQNSSHINNPRTNKFDVLMLSESDMAFLNNKAPQSFDESITNDIDAELDTNSSIGHFDNLYLCRKDTEGSNPSGSGLNQKTISEQKYPHHSKSFMVSGSAPRQGNAHIKQSALQETDPILLSSVSETKVLRALPRHSPESIDAAVHKIVTSEPLLTEDDLLYLVKKEYTGQPSPSRRLLKQILTRNNLQTEYKRFQAYMAG